MLFYLYTKIKLYFYKFMHFNRNQKSKDLNLKRPLYNLKLEDNNLYQLLKLNLQTNFNQKIFQNEKWL